VLDSTQRDARATVPLEPHGAATSNETLHVNQYFRRTGKERTSMYYIAFAIIHDGNTWILVFIPAFDDADLCFVLVNLYFSTKLVDKDKVNYKIEH